MTLQMVSRQMLLLSALATSATLAAGAAAQSPLIGGWISTAVSPAGVSALFEFDPGGQMSAASAAISEEKYRLAGTDTILLQSNNVPEQKLELEWDDPGHARIEDEAAGKFMHLARAGNMPDSKNPLVGQWNTMREWNGKNYPCRALFSKDGRVLWITMLRTDHGRYSSKENKIRLEVPGRPVVEGVFSFANELLMLPNPKGGESSFKRF